MRRWAEASGYFTHGSSIAPRTDGGESARVFSAGAAHAFAAKPITAIGIAAPPKGDPKVYIYTRRPLNRAEKKALEDENELSAPIEFRVARPFSVTSPSTAPSFQSMFSGEVVRCGSSISVGNVRDAGTLGALLKARGPTLYGLSCNHVTGGCSNARVDMPIVAPGILDVGSGGPLPRTVGLHKLALPFVQGVPAVVPNFGNNHDAALFEVQDPKAVSSSQGGHYDTPSRTTAPVEDAPVQKVGRTTRHTRGFIESQIVGPLRVDYDMTIHHSADENIAFKGGVFYEPVFMLRGRAGPFASSGDSGSLVVTDERTPKAVGLIIGGHPTTGETYMLPIEPVLRQAMGGPYRLVTGHGG